MTRLHCDCAVPRSCCTYRFGPSSRRLRPGPAAFALHGSFHRQREFALRWKLVADASRARGWRLEAVSPHWLRYALG
ncbi:hypothetical protein OM076_00845 [Solirubrobacter ginsenosidimutans]|uniref:Uncharacterized protein n=1 Tax=Solirubrobacter ginsenosidimutans TaxID=490573 RepID=A0A9X3MPE4_9ACTN|nr:hypothetical protein [Solirubrobacter ginsenosidimutans]MDA0158795.1 hypothetical protein [Solirubrobacter ginsenosidimutans]